MNRDFRILFASLFILISFILPETAFSQLKLGLNTGLTYNGLTGDAPEDASYKRKIGFTAGMQVEYNLSKAIIIGLGGNYYTTGTIVTYDIGEIDTKDSFDISISYISIPLTFKVLTGAQHTYFSSGLDYRQLLTADLKYLEVSLPDKDVKSRLEKYDVEIFAGFGGIISFGKPSIGLELRYSQSLLNISKDNPSVSSGLPARFRFSGFQLLVSFNFSAK